MDIKTLETKLNEIRPFNIKIEFRNNTVYFQETKYSVEWLFVGKVDNRLEALDVAANWLEQNDLESEVIIL